MHINTKSDSMNFTNELDGCSEFSCIFRLVKIAVESLMGKRRAGLLLGLTKLPNYIGAFHQLGSNFIIMNKTLLEKVIETEDKELINAYIFHVLLHEYIHSLGYINEQETQILTHKISERVLGLNHPATLIARYGLGSVLSGLKINHADRIEKIDKIEIINDFENENLNYFG